MPSREQALALWKEHNSDETLLRHALSVEAVMRHFATLLGGDADEWGVVGLLHDIDYQKYPEEHLAHTVEILEPAGYSESAIRAVLSHGWTLVNDVEPLSAMEKTLFTIDELTGFVTACVWVRPSRSVLDLEVSSVKKKWKTAAFAAAIRRDIVEKGALLLGLPLETLIAETILALRNNAAVLGLAGQVELSRQA